MSVSKLFAVVLFALSFLVLSACAPTAKRASTGEYLDDTVITTKVKAAIFNEPLLKTTEIGVETFKGTVQLSGFVKSAAASAKASEVVRTVNGVKDVKNSLIVK